jgi:hypothetical protein
VRDGAGDNNNIATCPTSNKPATTTGEKGNETRVGDLINTGWLNKPVNVPCDVEEGVFFWKKVMHTECKIMHL